MPDKIHRFDKLRYATPFIEDGLVSFGPALGYNDSKLTDAQRDNEQQRTNRPDPNRHQLAVGSPGEQAQPLEGVFRISVTYDIRDINGEFLRYHTLCCSLTDSPDFYDAFGAECCVTVHNVPEFHRRLNEAILDQLPGWCGGARRVTYVPEGSLFAPESTLDLIYAKNASYGWQQEFRFALVAPIDQAHDNRVSVRLGSLRDLCSIATR